MGEYYTLLYRRPWGRKDLRVQVRKDIEEKQNPYRQTVSRMNLGSGSFGRAFAKDA